MIHKGLIYDGNGKVTVVEVYPSDLNKRYTVRIYASYVPGREEYPDVIYHEYAKGFSKRAVKARAEKFLGKQVIIDWY